MHGGGFGERRRATKVFGESKGTYRELRSAFLAAIESGDAAHGLGEVSYRTGVGCEAETDRDSNARRYASIPRHSCEKGESELDRLPKRREAYNVLVLDVAAGAGQASSPYVLPYSLGRDQDQIRIAGAEACRGGSWDGGLPLLRALACAC